MNGRANWKYHRLGEEDRAKMIEMMMRNSESLASLAERTDVETENSLSDLWCFDHEAGEAIRVLPSDHEAVFLDGTYVAVPILMSFAIELAFKAMIAHAGERPWISTHDLECLYGQLTAEQRREIENTKKRPNRSTFRGEEYTDPGDFETVEATMTKHKNLFIDWRYQYENLITNRESPECSIHELQIAQWMIIDAANKMLGRTR